MTTFSVREREQFEEEGYVVREAALPPERVAHYMALLDGLVERAREVTSSATPWALEHDGDGKPIPGVLSKAQPVCVLEPGVRALANEPALVGPVVERLGPDVDYFGTKFFPKLPGGTTSTHWHQDNWFHRAERGRTISAAVYLEETTVETGCLRVVPGSHRDELHEHVAAPNGAWCTVDESTAVDLVCPAGTVVLFSTDLIHGAYDNFSDRSSYRTAWHYAPSSLDLERFPRGHADRHRAEVGVSALP